MGLVRDVWIWAEVFIDENTVWAEFIVKFFSYFKRSSFRIQNRLTPFSKIIPLRQLNLQPYNFLKLLFHLSILHPHYIIHQPHYIRLQRQLRVILRQHISQLFLRYPSIPILIKQFMRYLDLRRGEFKLEMVQDLLEIAQTDFFRAIKLFKELSLVIIIFHEHRELLHDFFNVGFVRVGVIWFVKFTRVGDELWGGGGGGLSLRCCEKARVGAGSGFELVEGDV